MKTLLRLTLSVILLGSLAAYWSPAPALSSPPQAATTGKPNIVLILADDLDSDAMQYMPKMKALIADRDEIKSQPLPAPSGE